MSDNQEHGGNKPNFALQFIVVHGEVDPATGLTIGEPCEITILHTVAGMEMTHAQAAHVAKCIEELAATWGMVVSQIIHKGKEVYNVRGDEKTAENGAVKLTPKAGCEVDEEAFAAMPVVGGKQ